MRFYGFFLVIGRLSPGGRQLGSSENKRPAAGLKRLRAIRYLMTMILVTTLSLASGVAANTR